MNYTAVSIKDTRDNLSEIIERVAINDLKQAQKVVRQANKANRKQIKKWANSVEFGRKEKFEFTFDKDIGYGVKRDNNEIHKYAKAKVILKKMEDCVKVVTAYPIK